MRVLRGRLSSCECASLPFGSGGGMWDLIVLVPDHCLSFSFEYSVKFLRNLTYNITLLTDFRDFLTFLGRGPRALWFGNFIGV